MANSFCYRTHGISGASLTCARINGRICHCRPDSGVMVARARATASGCVITDGKTTNPYSTRPIPYHICATQHKWVL
jgi:hypothetical protein